MRMAQFGRNYCWNRVWANLGVIKKNNTMKGFKSFKEFVKEQWFLLIMLGVISLVFLLFQVL